GERHMESSRYKTMGEVKPPDNNNIEEDKTKPPRDPVGMTDSDDHHPNVPTEPPNEEGAQGGNSKLMVELLGVYPC
ncbi:hypothetical protein PAXRUDRAFT_168646, partial [Paxillus rubicundulus Ve08.2h10]